MDEDPAAPPLSVRGEEEFNPTLSGRSRQSPGAPSLKHLLWKQKICGKKIRCCSVSTERSSFVFKSCKQEKNTHDRRDICFTGGKHEPGDTGEQFDVV